MATPPTAPRHRTHATFLLAGGLSLSLLAGCQAPARTAPTPAPSGSPVAAATGTPAATGPVAETMLYAEITGRYQAPVNEAENGWPILKPKLQPETPDGPLPSERLGALSLSDKPEDLAFFDKEVLPILQQSFSKPAFVETHPLLMGKDPLTANYRDLRQLCELLGQRADLLWKQGKKKEALEMLRLPLSLAKALQSRPETVSVNDFSSSYARAALRDIADWAGDNSLKGAELEQAAKMLAEYRPHYAHVVETITVDFAQLENSINDKAIREENLGLGLARTQDLTLWKEQLRGLLDEAKKLYGFQPSDAQLFNDEVMKMSAQVHGLVIDYPQITTQQKHAYASYLATELALALERHRLSGNKKPLEAAKLVETTFAGDADAQEAANALLVYKPGQAPGSFTISSRGDVFKLLSPEGFVTFYQR